MNIIKKRDSLEIPLHEKDSESNFSLSVKVLETSVNSLLYILLGCILIINLWFVFNGQALDKYRLHILLCVLGVSVLSLVLSSHFSISFFFSSSIDPGIHLPYVNFVTNLLTWLRLGF